MPDRLDIASGLAAGLEGENFAERIRDESAPDVFANTIGPFCHDDLQVAMVSGGAGLRNEHRGVDGFVAAWRDWLQPFESFRIEIDEDIVGSGDVLLGYARQTGVLTGGGEVNSDAAAVMFFRDGLLARVEFHMDRAEALRAAGLG